ncbi:hypothetical protein JCM16307_01690 [Thermococcus prieurii]
MVKKRLLVEQYLISKLAQDGIPLGKTKFQKLMYLLTVKKIVDVPDYQLYHFGPYSSVVDLDLTYLKHDGTVRIEWIDYGSGYYGYRILPEDTKGIILTERNINTQAIDKILEGFGKLNTRELSILATAIYLYEQGITDRDVLVDKVHKLKPNYSKGEIKSILDRYLDEFLELSL